MEWIFEQSTWIKTRNSIKAQWSELTDDQLDAIAGKRDELVKRLEENFGVSRQDANRQVEEWESRNGDLFAQTAEQIKPYLGIARQ